LGTIIEGKGKTRKEAWKEGRKEDNQAEGKGHPDPLNPSREILRCVK